MEFFKRLFGGGTTSPSSGKKGAPGDRGIYFFVQPDGCEEVIRVRIDPINDLSESDDGKTYHVRKLASGVKCFKRVEMEFAFNANKQLVEKDVKGGTLVDEAAWIAWTSTQA